MRKYNIVFLIVVLIIGAAVLLYLDFWRYHERPALAAQHKWLAMVDMNADGQLDLESLHAGDDVLIIIHPQHDLVAGKHYFELKDLDQNRDGLISADDPGFALMRVLSVGPWGKIVMVPMTAAGLQAIRLQHSAKPGHSSVVTSDSVERFARAYGDVKSNSK